MEFLATKALLFDKTKNVAHFMTFSSFT